MATELEKALKSLKKSREDNRSANKRIKFLEGAAVSSEAIASGAVDELAGLRGEGVLGTNQRLNALLEGLDPEVKKAILKDPALLGRFLKEAREPLPAAELTSEQKTAEITEQRAQRITEGALRLTTNTDAIFAEALIEVTEVTKQAEVLQRQLQADNALPFSEKEFNDRMEKIRSLERRGGFGESSPVEKIVELQGDAQKALQGKATSKLSLAVGGGAIDPDLTPEFLRRVNAEPKNLEAIVKEFSTKQVAAARIDRGILSRALETVTGKFSLGEVKKGVISGDISPGAGIKKAGRIRGIRGAGLGALAIPLLLSLFGGKKGGEDQPEELDLRQLFLQRQSQELAGSQAKLNSQLGLNDARRTKATAQAEGQLLRNLLLMQQISGGGATSLP